MREEAEYLSRRIEVLLKIYTLNPLTKEEIKFLRKFFSKRIDKISIEDAEKVYEIGKGLFVEDFDDRGFLIAMAVIYIRGYLVSKRIKEKKK